MFISQTVLIIIIGFILGLAIAYKLFRGLLSAFFMPTFPFLRSAPATASGESNSPPSISSVIILITVVLILWLAYQKKQKNPKPLKAPETYHLEQINYNKSPSEEKHYLTSENNTSSVDPKRSGRNEIVKDHLTNKLHDRNTPSILEKINKETAIIESKKHFVQLFSLSFKKEALDLMKSLSKRYGSDLVHLDIVKETSDGTLTSKILIGPFTNKEEARHFITINKENIPDGAWIRQIKDFNKLYSIRNLL